ncbi:MobV family relaxase [Bacillus sp. JJ722]|uniref:MobV family relaxase n=1 Tax=Bacillus sp. JJ722 TaxID=3122973 RepID=UPI002FFFD95D
MSSYCIIRMQKFNMSDVQGIQKHNQRQMKNFSNHDIDPSRIHLNVDLINGQKLKYENEIKQRIDARVKRKPRSNSVVLSEFVVSASPEYIKSLSPGEQKIYFEKSLDFIQARYGKENVLYGMIHNDETTPHMHVGVVPITEDNRLSAKDIFNKTELRELQTDFHEHLVRSGFEVERGESSDRKGLSVQEFKKQQIEKELEVKERELDSLTKVLKNPQVPFLKKEEELQVKEKFFGKIEIIKKENKNYVLTPEQFQTMKSKVHAAVALKEDYERLKKTDLVKENKQLKIERDFVADEWAALNKENKDLREENKKLKKDNTSLKAQNSILRDNIRVLYKSTKEVFKEKFEAFRDFLKTKMINANVENYFDKVHAEERKKVRERNSGMER